MKRWWSTTRSEQPVSRSALVRAAQPQRHAHRFQQGTFAPDATYRWMGSIAMDQAGNIALGYSVSSSID